jgi:hypothetical protein
MAGIPTRGVNKDTRDISDAALESGRFAGAVEADHRAAVANGITGIPPVTIGNQTLSGAVPYEAYERALRQTLFPAAEPDLDGIREGNETVMTSSETGIDFNPNRAGGAGSGDTGDDAPYDPATRTGDPSASGNPGANNPGVGDLGAGEAGVTMDPGVARGFVNPGNVGTGASSVMGAGGIGGTGVAGGVAPEQVQVAAGTGDPDAAGAGAAPSAGTLGAGGATPGAGGAAGDQNSFADTAPPGGAGTGSGT